MTTEKILNLGAIVGGVSLAALVYVNYFWKPKVVVSSVDYVKGTASLTINGKAIDIYAGSTYDCGLGWGVKFSPHVNKNSPYFIPRIELTKHHLVNEYLNIKQPVAEKTIDDKYLK